MFKDLITNRSILFLIIRKSHQGYSAIWCRKIPLCPVIRIKTFISYYDMIKRMINLQVIIELFSYKI